MSRSLRREIRKSKKRIKKFFRLKPKPLALATVSGQTLAIESSEKFNANPIRPAIGRFLVIGRIEWISR
jgi:hypothetical protein